MGTKISEVIELVRGMMAEAEENFNRRSEMLMRQVGRKSFSVFELGAATEVIAETKKLTDDLYASYESYVRLVDADCRPFLNSGAASAKEIKSVLTLIRDINERSSGISNNISGSFGGDSIDMHANYYLASLEAKAIEKAWEAAYAMTSEAKEEKRVHLERQYVQSGLAREWDLLLERIKPARDTAEAYARSYKDTLYAVLRKIPTLQSEYADSLLKMYEEESAKKAKLGFFDFSAKKTINNKMQILKRRETLKRSSDYTREVRSKFTREADDFVNKYISTLEKHIEKYEYSFLQITETKYSSQAMNEVIKDEIYCVLALFGELTIDEIIEHGILFKKYEVTQQKIAACVRQLYMSMVVTRKEDYGIARFSVCDNNSNEKVRRRIEQYSRLLNSTIMDLPHPSVDESDFEQMIVDYIKA